MAQFLVRNLEDDVRDKLRELARKHGQSLEETVRDILRRAVMRQEQPRPRLGSRIAERFASLGWNGELPELRGETVDPPSFDADAGEEEPRRRSRGLRGSMSGCAKQPPALPVGLLVCGMTTAQTFTLRRRDSLPVSRTQ